MSIENNNIKNNNTIIIKKASGEEEIFDIEKLKKSLRNAGVKDSIITKIANDINNWVYPGVNTRKIYSRTFSILRKEKTTTATRYKLKQAIRELGPTGYPFEKFIGQLFEKLNFKTQTGIVVEGNCVTHEMDVIATKDNIQNLIECKYHKDQGRQVSIQVPLYVRSRINDIINKRKNLPEYKGLSFTGWVITNTRFSSESIKYGKCCGLNLMAWDYPKGNGLKDVIEKIKVHPITILNNLTKKEKIYLLEQDIVCCQQLLKNIKYLDDLNLSNKKYNSLMNELNDICI